MSLLWGMAYVRKVVTASGATAVQVCEKVGDRQKVLAHIGSAHDEVGLALLMDEAHKWLQAPGQGEARFRRFDSRWWGTTHRWLHFSPVMGSTRDGL